MASDGESSGTTLPLAVPASQRERLRPLVEPHEAATILQGALAALTKEPLRVTSCSPKPSRSRTAVREQQVRIAYRMQVEVGDEVQERVVLGIAPVGPEYLEPGLVARARALARHPSARPFETLATHVAEHRLALFLFPLDPALPGLPASTGDEAADLLARHLPECRAGARVVGAASELRHYKPFSRTVLRLTADLELPGGERRERAVYVKLFADDRGAAIDRELRTLFEATRKASALRVPEALGYDPALRMMVMAEAPGRREATAWIKRLERGRPLPEGIDVRRLEACLAIVAEALRELQTCGIRVARQRTFQDELRQLGKDHELLDAARAQDPELVARVERPLARLAELAPRRERFVPAHGGFRHKQTVGDESSLTIIDWDGLSMASPALDPATFLARLRQEPLRTPGAAPEMARLAEGFRRDVLSGPHGVEPRELSLYEGLVLTERALRAFRRPNAGQRAGAQIRRFAEAAERALDGAEGRAG